MNLKGLKFFSPPLFFSKGRGWGWGPALQSFKIFRLGRVLRRINNHTLYLYSGETLPRTKIFLPSPFLFKGEGPGVGSCAFPSRQSHSLSAYSRHNTLTPVGLCCCSASARSVITEIIIIFKSLQRSDSKRRIAFIFSPCLYSRAKRG